jgi:dienelactone hydrolase
MYPAPDFVRSGVDSFYFTNEPWHGDETRVFGWKGMPYLKDGETCPGMVLVHGGGGTAFDQWVRLWNSRGYAAIAIDLCGAVPERPEVLPSNPRERHAHGGPSGWDSSFSQMDDDVEDHWQYHAITALLRAHTILADMDGVDAARIGITGISWGGYMTSLMMGVDPRLAAAIPVYGCGFITENSCWKTNGYGGRSKEVIDRWTSLWEPRDYIPNAKMPTLWVNGTNDFAYPMDSFHKSYSSVDDATLTIGIELPHGHEPGWAPHEIHHFTDSLFFGRAPLAEHLWTEAKHDVITSRFTSERPLMRADVCFTRATGMWQDRKWNPQPEPVKCEDGVYIISGTLPVGTTVAFVNVWDDRGLRVSSPHIEFE